MALCSLDHGSRRARRCGASTPGIDLATGRSSLLGLGETCFQVSCVSGQFKTQLSPSLRAEEQLNPLASLFLVLPAALQTFLVWMGTTALPRASAAPQAPGACGRSWGCWLFSRVPVQLWPFFALWAGHCVPGETVPDPRVLGSVPPCPHPVTFGSKREMWDRGALGQGESSLCHAHLSLAFLIYRIREGPGLQDRGKGGLLTN